MISWWCLPSCTSAASLELAPLTNQHGRQHAVSVALPSLERCCSPLQRACYFSGHEAATPPSPSLSWQTTARASRARNMYFVLTPTSYVLDNVLIPPPTTRTSSPRLPGGYNATPEGRNRVKIGSGEVGGGGPHEGSRPSRTERVPSAMSVSSPNKHIPSWLSMLAAPPKPVLSSRHRVLIDSVGCLTYCQVSAWSGETSAQGIAQLQACRRCEVWGVNGHGTPVVE